MLEIFFPDERTVKILPISPEKNADGREGRIDFIRGPHRATLMWCAGSWFFVETDRPQDPIQLSEKTFRKVIQDMISQQGADEAHEESRNRAGAGTNTGPPICS